MGCTSSTEVVIDPVTGQEKKKKKLGGAYPGQRRPQAQQQYTPSASQFGADGQATVHFIAYGGGNALTLVKKDGTHQPETGKPQSEYIQVTLPDGVKPGQTIHVQAPDGRLNAIVIPPGFGPGSIFTVEFAPEEQPPSDTKPTAPFPDVGTASTPQGNDGFATGFNHPNYVPPPAASATAVSASEPEVHVAAVAQEEADIDLSAYPTTSATPIYSSK